MTMEEIIKTIKLYNNNIQERMTKFISDCYSLEESSNGEYQVQKTIELNKIYFQGYVLDSKICRNLQKDNIDDYSLTDLKEYINKNFNYLEIDCTPYYEALILYEKANALEDLVDKKIELEIDFLSNYVSKLKILKEQVLDKEELVNLYSQAKEELVNDLAKKVIVSEEQDNYFNILNDIFEYFWSGYPLLS